jgi:hypothetical protein
MTLILGILSSAGSWLLKTLGLPMCVLIGFYFWEEGAPFASYLVIPASVPLVGGFGVGNIIPLLGDLAIGHVQSRVNEAVAGARHGFAIEQENAAAKAQHDTEAENARKAAVVTAGFNILLSKTNAQKNQTSKDYTDAMQRAAKAAAAAGIKCDRLDAGRADVLRKHGFKIIE